MQSQRSLCCTVSKHDVLVLKEHANEWAGWSVMEMHIKNGELCIRARFYVVCDIYRISHFTLEERSCGACRASTILPHPLSRLLSTT
jgi:hypothetical protein